MHPECVTTPVMILWGLILSICAVILRTVAKMCNAIWIILSVVLWIFRKSLGILSKGRTGRRESISKPKSRTWDKRRYSLLDNQKPLLGVLTLLMVITNAIDVTRIIKTKEEQCTTQEDGHLHCTFNEMTVFKVFPHGQSLYLLLQDSKARPMGTLKLEIKDTFLECSKRTLMFTRNHKIKVDSVKRCSSKGRCVGRKCADFTSNQTIDEMPLANQFPGITFCSESCGGWTCGCGYWTSACLFYRLYAIPINLATYEIFECIKWDIAVSLALTLETNVQSESQNFTLHPGLTYTWNNVRVSATTTTPITSATQLKFMKTDVHTGIIQETDYPLITQLSCANRAAANRFSPFLCGFDPAICHCERAEKEAICACRNATSAFTRWSNHLLPESYAGVWIEPSPEGAVKGRSAVQELEIGITVDNLETRTKIDHTRCTVQVTEPKGCFSCTTGAVMNATCQTDKGQTVAHIECEKFSFALKCNEKLSQIHEQVHFYVASANVNESCSVSCPGFTTKVRISGRLEAPSLQEISYDEAKGGTLALNDESSLWDDIKSEITKRFSYYTSFAYFFWEHYKSLTLLFSSLLILVITGYFISPVLLLVRCLIGPIRLLRRGVRRAVQNHI